MGGGSGGGSFFNYTKSQRIAIEKLSDLILNAGDTKKLMLSVKNNGNTFLNNCLLKGSGNYQSWITPLDGIKKIGVGEKSGFLFNIEVPKDASRGNYNVGIEVQCDESRASTNLSVEILEKKLEFKILETKREKNNLKISYSIKELSGISQDVKIDFSLFTETKEKVLDYTETEILSQSEEKTREVLIPINSSLTGNFNLLININSEQYSTFVQENIFLGSISGFSIFSAGNNQIISPSTIILILIFAVFASLIIIRIVRLKKRQQYIPIKPLRQPKRVVHL